MRHYCVLNGIQENMGYALSCFIKRGLSSESKTEASQRKMMTKKFASATFLAYAVITDVSQRQRRREKILVIKIISHTV